MRLQEKHINQFIELYKSKYGVLLERNEAIRMATQFASCIRVVESNVVTGHKS
jgi:hypothetical protein